MIELHTHAQHAQTAMLSDGVNSKSRSSFRFIPKHSRRYAYFRESMTPDPIVGMPSAIRQYSLLLAL